MQAVLRTIKILDLSPLHEAYRGTGSKPYRPELMLAIALVEILLGETSPARWHLDAKTRDQCKFLGRGITPSRTAWYDFRDRAGKFIESVHQQLVQHALANELINPCECSIDGTLTSASASRHKIFNLKQINRRRSQLKRVIKTLDDPSQTSAKQALSSTPKWIAVTAQGRARQHSSYGLAKLRLLENIRENRSKHCRYRRDESRMVISPADVDAVIGKDKLHVVRPLYNSQFLTDCNSDITIAYGVWAQNNDNGTLAPMIQSFHKIASRRLTTLHADSGYCSILDIKDCKSLGVDLLAPVQDNPSAKRKLENGEIQIPSSEFTFDDEKGSLTCPAGHVMKRVREVQVPRACGRTVGEIRFEQSVSHCSSCPLASRCLGKGAKRRTVSRQSEQPLLDAQNEKMLGPAGKRSRVLRAQTIERRFADGKQHRNQNQQNGRGLRRVRAEVGMLVVAQNTIALHNLEKQKKNTTQ